jgi:general stress protein YciG
MDTGKQKEIASKGGRAAHAKGTAHEFDSNEAREAGRKGGMAVSRNREHMAMIGRRGGEARGHARTRNAAQTNSQAVGGNTEGAVQNSRNASNLNQVSRANTIDRQVEIPGQNDGYSSQGTRGGNNSLGGENRANTNDSVERNPNH